MDIIAKIDRTLLDNELRNMVRFPVFIESDKALVNATYKIKIDNGYPYFTLGASFHAIPYDDTNRKFILVNDTHVMEIELSTNDTFSIRSSNCIDPYKWHAFTSYLDPKTFYRIHVLYEACLKDSKNYHYEEGAYNYEKYVKSL